jgi:hypothetical protein
MWSLWCSASGTKVLPVLEEWTVLLSWRHCPGLPGSRAHSGWHFRCLQSKVFIILTSEAWCVKKCPSSRTTLFSRIKNKSSVLIKVDANNCQLPNIFAYEKCSWWLLVGRVKCCVCGHHGVTIPCWDVKCPVKLNTSLNVPMVSKLHTI